MVLEDNVNHKFFKRIRRFKIAFAVLIGLDLIIILMFGIMRFKDNLWPNQEIWVDETNEKAVISQVEEWHLPTEGITRVVKIPGLGDMEFKVYYKDGSNETTGWLHASKVSNKTVQLVEEYGENEGSRSARKVYFALSAVFFLTLLSEVIILKIENFVEKSLMEEDAKEKCRNERRFYI